MVRGILIQTSIKRSRREDEKVEEGIPVCCVVADVWRSVVKND